ncbi:MAG: SGNH/GDSL hydrolase family protein [Anaerolineae bacterium]|nr:SGNH/GDSL hydrolase family protein [Anaerolineae bacterium]
MKISFLGASLTEGVYGGNYVNAVAAHLPEHTLVNRGVGGSTVNKLLGRVERVLSDAPDACFVLAGSNDALAYAFPATRPYYKSQQDLPDGYLEPEAYAALLRDLLTELSLNHVLVLVGLPPMEYNPAAVAAMHLFNAQTRSIAQALNLPVFDFGAHLNPPSVPERPPLGLQTVFQIGDRVKAGWADYDAERAAGGYTYSFDGIHFTPAAAAQAGAVLAGWLRSELA